MDSPGITSLNSVTHLKPNPGRLINRRPLPCTWNVLLLLVVDIGVMLATRNDDMCRNTLLALRWQSYICSLSWVLYHDSCCPAAIYIST